MLVVNCGSPRVPEIVKHVEELGYKATVVSLELLQPRHLKEAPGAIFSGSPRMISEENVDFLERYAFIREANIPMMGICFGHQLLGTLHGAEIRKNRADGSMITGNREVWLENSRLFDGIDPVSVFRQDHEEEITLPEDFVLLASSDETRVEAMCHKEKPIYSMQFHPEVSGHVGAKIFENFVKKVVAEHEVLVH